MMGEHISGGLAMLLGMGIVFIGLVALIFITKLMSALCGIKKQPQEAVAVAAPAVVAAPPAAAVPQADRGAFVAAVSAAVAETMGTDPAGLRIHSIRRI